jgi:hypothetical protein
MMPQENRKHAVVYYSRGGHTDTAAHKLAAALDAELIRLETDRYKSGVFGFMRAGFESLTDRLPELTPVETLKDYASVSLGGPVWTSLPATPLRAFLAQHPPLPDAVGLFLSSGSDEEPDQALRTARELLGHPFVATLSLPEDLDEATSTQRIEAYCDAMRAASGGGATS